MGLDDKQKAHIASVGDKLWKTALILLVVLAIGFDAFLLSEGPDSILGTTESRWWFGAYLLMGWLPVVGIIAIRRWVGWVARKPSP